MARQLKSTKTLASLPALLPTVASKPTSALRIVSPIAHRKKSDVEELLEKIERHMPNTGTVEKAIAAAAKGSHLFKVKVTPEIAMDLLSLNKESNRTINVGYVDRYVRDMRSGKFKYVGDTIQIDTNKKLINGQKRLLAIIISGIPQYFHIEAGFEAETMEVLDIGQPRSTTDILKILKIPGPPHIVAAVVKKIIQFRTKQQVQGSFHVRDISSQDVVEFLKDGKKNNVEELGRMIELACKKDGGKDHPFLTITEWAFAHYLLSFNAPKRKEQADFFIRSLMTGQSIADSGRTAPIYYLRTLLQGWHNEALRNAGMKKKDRANTTLKFKYIIRYWNDWVLEAFKNKDYGRARFDREYKESLELEQPK